MILGAIVIIVVGILVVNYFKRSDTGETLPISETEIIEGLDENLSVGGMHEVSERETLWSISEAVYGSGYNWVDIARANNIDNPKMIEAGQKLNLPDVESKLAPALEMDSQTSGKIESKTYTVIKGDNLWEIAVKTYGDGYKWVEIAGENNLSNPNLIHPGNTLKLP